MRGALFIGDPNSIDYLTSLLDRLGINNNVLFSNIEMKTYPQTIDKVYIIPEVMGTATLTSMIDILRIHDVSIIVGDTSSWVTSYIPYLAGLLSGEYIGFIDDIYRDEQGFVIKKTIFTGELIVKYRVRETPIFLTINPSKVEGNLNKEAKEAIYLSESSPFYKILTEKEKEKDKIDIQYADVIVSVGRGFKNIKDLELAEELSNIVGGVVGCSRPIATDLKWLPEERWIGLSGKKVEPRLYIAIGISGQPQHLAGIRRAKKILAINIDPEAPIFQHSDYCVVADLYDILPLLIRKLKEQGVTRS
jgi:electron transfer flavoprotein alpha subunit